MAAYVLTHVTALVTAFLQLIGKAGWGGGIQNAFVVALCSPGARTESHRVPPLPP